MLEPLQAIARQPLQRQDVQAQSIVFDTAQATDAFAKQHRGTVMVAPLQVQVGDGDLQDTLENRP